MPIFRAFRSAPTEARNTTLCFSILATAWRKSRAFGLALLFALLAGAPAAQAQDLFPASIGAIVNGDFAPGSGQTLPLGITATGRALATGTAQFGPDHGNTGAAVPFLGRNFEAGDTGFDAINGRPFRPATEATTLHSNDRSLIDNGLTSEFKDAIGFEVTFSQPVPISYFYGVDLDGIEWKTAFAVDGSGNVVIPEHVLSSNTSLRTISDADVNEASWNAEINSTTLPTNFQLPITTRIQPNPANAPNNGAPGDHFRQVLFDFSDANGDPVLLQSVVFLYGETEVNARAGTPNYSGVSAIFLAEPEFDVTKGAAVGTLQPDDTVNITYTINVENSGTAPFSDVSVSDALSFSPFTIVSGPTLVTNTSNPNSINPTPNTAWDGTGDTALLTTAANALAIDDSFQIEFTVNTPASNGPVDNQVSVSGNADLYGPSATVSDLSDPSTDADGNPLPGTQPGGPGAPTITNLPTPRLLPLPTEVASNVCAIAPSTEFFTRAVRWESNGSDRFAAEIVNAQVFSRADRFIAGPGITGLDASTSVARIDGVDQPTFADAYAAGDYLEYTVQTIANLSSSYVLSGIAENGGSVGPAYKVDLLASDDNFSTAVRILSGFEIRTGFNFVSELEQQYLDANTEYKFRLVMYDSANPGQQISMDDFALSADQCADMGDADFPNTSANGGSHLLPSVRNHYIGAVSPDAEFFVNADDNASGDVQAGEEEVSFPTFNVGSTATVNIPVIGSGGLLNGWIDWNQNQVFDAGERVATDEAIPGGGASGTIALSVDVPAGATLGDTWARLRWSPTSISDPVGDVAEGELEDHPVTVAETTVPLGPNSFGTRSSVVAEVCSAPEVFSTFQFNGTGDTTFEGLQIISTSSASTGVSWSDLIDPYNRGTGTFDSSEYTIIGGGPIGRHRFFYRRFQIDGLNDAITQTFSGKEIYELQFHLNSLDQYGLQFNPAENPGVGWEILSSSDDGANIGSGGTLFFTDIIEGDQDRSGTDEELDGDTGFSADGTIRFYSTTDGPLERLVWRFVQDPVSAGVADGGYFGFQYCAPTPELDVAKSATVGAPKADGTVDVTYTVTAENTGDVFIENVTLLDDLTATDQLGGAFNGVVSSPAVAISGATAAGSTAPAGNADYDGGDQDTSLIDTGGVLAIGDTLTAVFTVNVNPNDENAPTPLQNSATATATPPGSTIPVSDDSDTDTAPDGAADGTENVAGGPGAPTIITPPTEVGTIGLVKSSVLNDDDGVDGVSAGDTIDYTYVVTNTSATVNVFNVSVSEPNDATNPFTGTGTVPVPAYSTGGADLDDSDGTATDLAAGETVTFTASYILTQEDIDAGKVDNSATASGTDPAGNTATDASDDNNDGAGDTAAGEDDPTSTPLGAAPQLDVAKSASVGTLQADGTVDVTYTVVVENSGNVTLDTVTLIDDLTATDQLGGAFNGVVTQPVASGAAATGSALPAAFTGYDGTNSLIGTGGVLAPSDTMSVVFTVNVDPNATGAASPLQNSAVAGGDDPSGTTVTDASDTDTAPDGAADGTDNVAGGPGAPTIITPPTEVGTIGLVKSSVLNDDDGVDGGVSRRRHNRLHLCRDEHLYGGECLQCFGV